MKAIEQYFPVVLFITLYKVVLTFESVDKILKRDHASESYWAVFPVVLFIILYKVILTFEFADKIEVAFKWKPLSSTFLWQCLFFN